MDRYDEALARARAGKSLEEIFPEMNESEDERIRKELIEYLTHRAEVTGFVDEDKDCKRWIAYLEKLGEQKYLYYDQGFVEGMRQANFLSNSEIIVTPPKITNKVSVSEELYEHIRETCACIDDAMSSETLVDITDYLEMADKSAQAAFDMLEKQQKEQTEELSTRLNGLMQEYVKSGKDEEEQEHRLKCYKLFWDALEDSEFFEQFKQKEQKPEACIPDSVKFEEGFKTGRELGFREGVESVKPAECSEEDKKRIQRIYDFLWKNRKGDTDTIYQIEKDANWLKSLPERFNFLPKQEWSEEYREEDLRTRFAFYTYKNEEDDTTLYLSNVFVEEASRNKGFGTKILAAAEKVAETFGMSSICLKVKQDSPANAWYRKNGYGYVSFEGDYDWLEKNLEYMKPNKQEWSEDDERLLDFWLDVIDRNDWRMDEYFCKASREFINRLKSLRHQPKAELTLLDENIINAAVAFVEQNNHFNCWAGIDKNTVIKALRSLKPHWKPSEEQMEVNLEKIIEQTYHDGSVADTSDMDHVAYDNIARHFYELGVNARKEE